jgi:ATP-binding cassette subfamily C protein LapB
MSAVSINPFPAKPAASGDDSLLACLVTLCRTLHEPRSADALIAGLPLVNGKLTPELFVRSAQRVGLSAAVVQRSLADIPDLVLPAVLMTTDGGACILSRKDGQVCELMETATQGVATVPLEKLSAAYSGQAIFVRHHFRFDQRAQAAPGFRPRHWFWDVIWKSWPIYADVLLASLLINLFALASPLFVMNVYDRVVPNYAEETLWVLAIGMLIVSAFDAGMKALRSYFLDAAGKRADMILSSTVFERVLGIRTSAKPESVGAFANNLQEYEYFRDFITSATLTTVIDLPFLVLFLLIMALIGGYIALIPLVILPLGIVVALVMQQSLKKEIGELFRYSSQKNATLIESIAGLDAIKAYGAEGQFQRRWEDIISNIGTQGVKVRALSQGAVNATTLLQQIAYLLVVIAGVYLITDNQLTMGGLIACTIFTSRALTPLSQVASLLVRYHQAKASLDSLNRMMNLPTERDNESRFLHRPKLTGRIEFKNVSFSYPNSPVKALNDISFTIAEGERVAIVGRIGCGKTTLEKLIMGLYEPQEGAVLVDGTDLRQLDPIDLRRNIGYMPQETQLFYGNVRDNIVMGAPFMDDASVLRAAELAGVTAFTNTHPMGFDLPVGERGSQLSGGQRQSIALARAMLLSPPIYVMDEPTNAMDNSTEEQFKARFAEEVKGKTLIVVTHRASLLSLVDRVIVLDRGHIVANGPKDRVLDALKHGQIKVSMS